MNGQLQQPWPDKYMVTRGLDHTEIKTSVIPPGKPSRPAEVLVQDAANLEWIRRRRW